MIQNPAPEKLIWNRRLIAGNIAVLFSSSVVAQGMSLLALLLTARVLGPESYGQYTASFLLAYFAAIFINLGLDTWLLKKGGQQPAHLGEWYGSVLVTRSILGAVWFTAIWLFARLSSSQDFPPDLVQFAALFVWIEILLFTIITAFKAALRNITSSILEVSTDVIWLAATIFLVSHGNQQVDNYAQVRLISVSLIFPVSLILIWRFYRPKPTMEAAVTSLRESPPFAVSQFLSMLLMRVDVLIISFVLGSYAVGIYAPAVGLVGALFLIPNAIFMVITPVLSNLFSYDLKQAWRTSMNNIGLQALLGAILSLLIWLGANLIVVLLGDQYYETTEILRILSPILFLHSITFGLAAIIIAANLQAKRAIVQTVAAGFNILLNLIIINWAGIRGVAVVFIITEILLVVGYTLIVLNFYNRNLKPSVRPDTSLPTKERV